MNHITTTILLASAAAFLTGCSSLKVTSEQTADFDFASVKTYEWVGAPEDVLEESDTLLSKDLHKLLNNELAARGWRQVLESDLADIQVIYYIKLSEHEEFTAPPSSGNGEPELAGGFTFNNDTGTWSANTREPDINVYTVDVGTLTVLIHNTGSDEMIWRGTLQTKINRGLDAKKREQMLRNVARKIITEIP